MWNNQSLGDFAYIPSLRTELKWFMKTLRWISHRCTLFYIPDSHLLLAQVLAVPWRQTLLNWGRFLFLHPYHKISDFEPSSDCWVGVAAHLTVFLHNILCTHFNTFFLTFRYLEAGSNVKGFTRTERKLLVSQLLSSEVEVLPSFTDGDVHRRHSERGFQEDEIGSTSNGR